MDALDDEKNRKENKQRYKISTTTSEQSSNRIEHLKIAWQKLDCIPARPVRRALQSCSGRLCKKYYRLVV